VGSAYIFVRSGTSWTLQQQLTVLDDPQFENFGASVALSGETALIGAPRDAAPGAFSLTGSAYVFVRDVTTWSLQQKLTAYDARRDDQFGRAVALDGDTAVVGVPFDDNAGLANSGSAYVFVRSGTSWSTQQKIQLAEGALPRDAFGRSVAISGDTALVGSPLDDTIAGSVDAGTAFIFVRSGTTWTLQRRIKAYDPRAYDNFGTSVALSGDTALVGSPYNDNANGGNAGAVYVYVRSGTSWSLQTKLLQQDGGGGDAFGSSVRLDGETALVGAPRDDLPQCCGLDPLTDAGSAHVFVRSGTTWSPQASFSQAAAGDIFGSSLGLSGDTALVGAPGDDIPQCCGLDPLADAGSAHVFVRSGTSWSLQQMLTAPSAAPGDGFASSSDLTGETALVGAPGRDASGSAPNTGSAYAFLRSGTAWGSQQEITANDRAQFDNFGTSVALGVDRALVGSPFDDTAVGTDAGSAYFFTRSGTTWIQSQKINATDAARNDRFGSSVAQDLDTFLIGSPQDGPNRNGVGAAYVFVGP
jgi:hypothetical protein